MPPTNFRILPILLFLFLSPLAARADNPVSTALDATLMLYADDPGRQFLGSGFVYDGGEVALTNAHVVGQTTTVRARRRDGSETVLRVLARDDRRDIALLDWPQGTPGLSPTPQTPSPGTGVIALGAPLEAGFSATRGIVSADPHQTDPTVPLFLLQHDAAINPGSSGGPLIDTAGRLIGMNSQIADGSRLYVGISYAIQAADLARLVPQLRAGTLRPMPSLGLHLRPVGPRIAAGLGIAEAGLLVDDVAPGSAAMAAGIRPGDVLLALDGSPLSALGSLSLALARASLRADVDILRAGVLQRLTLDFRPEPRPAPAARPPAAAPAPVRLGLTLGPDGSVAALADDGAARAAGVILGDRILLANGAPVTAALGITPLEKPLVLLVARDGRHLHLTIDHSAPPGRLRHLAGGNALDLAVRQF